MLHKQSRAPPAFDEGLEIRPRNAQLPPEPVGDKIARVDPAGDRPDGNLQKARRLIQGEQDRGGGLVGAGGLSATHGRASRRILESRVGSVRRRVPAGLNGPGQATPGQPDGQEGGPMRRSSHRPQI